MCESRQHTIYAGFFEKNILVIISNDRKTPDYFDFDYSPNVAALIKNDT